MNLRTKIAIGLIILVALLTIGTSVKAVEFRSRILNTGMLNLGAYATITDGDVVVSTVDPQYNFSTDTPVYLTQSAVIKAKTLYCVEKPVHLGNGVNYYLDPKDSETHKYPNIVDGKASWEDYLIAYILSEPETKRETLAEGFVQQAIWAWLQQTTPNDLYKAAEKYADYKKEAETQKIVIDTAKAHSTEKDGGYVFGPFKATFPSAYYKHGDFERSFGEVINVKLVDKNGNEISKDKWKIVDKDYNDISGYPKSRESFYIITNTTAIDMPVKLKMSFNTVDAEGYLQYLYGTYWASTITTSEEDASGPIHYCDECQAIIDAHDGVVNGYVYDNKTTKVNCGSVVMDTDSGNTGAKLESHTAACGLNVSCADGKQRVCGTKYYYFGVELTASCFGGNKVNVSYRDYVAKVGCGKVITDYSHIIIDQKTGDEYYNKWRCGYGYISHDHEERSQELIQVWGTRKTKEDVATIDVDDTAKIIKIDAKSKKPLAGATLAIYDKDGNEVRSWVSTEEAYILDPMLEPGEYTLVEKEVPAGYIKADDIKIVVSSDGKMTPEVVEMEDTPEDGIVKFIKKDAKTNEYLAGAKLKLVDSNENEINHWTTDGTPHIEKLKPGKYTLIETEAPSGYRITGSKEFVVTENGIEGLDVAEIVLYNSKDGTLVKIKKVDEETGKTLEGAKLEIRDSQGNVMNSWVTEDGYHQAKLAPGKYKLVETEVPDGYRKAVDIDFEVDEDGLVGASEIVMKDPQLKVKFKKIDAETGDGLAGAELGILDSNGELVTSWETDGNYHEVQLKIGKYTLTELKVPKGYKKADDMPFEVNKDGLVGSDTLVMKDQPQDTFDLSLRKYITNITDKYGNNVEMTVNYGQAASSRIPQVDASKLITEDNPEGDTTAKYNHPKDPVDVAEGDLITYTIRVYNEGYEYDSYAREIKDHIPSELEYVEDNEINKKYGWTVDGDTLTTTYLQESLLTKFTGGELSSDYVQVVLRVKDNVEFDKEMVNSAEISKYGYLDGEEIIEEVTDRDSLPNNRTDYRNKVQQEDDDDFEVVKLTAMDLSGVLWKDGLEGKQNERDGKLTDKDERVPNHTVYLSGGESRTTTTDGNGKYCFKRVQINKDYQISFEYEGQEFIQVAMSGFGEDESAGSESEADRTALNTKFREIVKDTARNDKQENTVSLRYTKNTEDRTSTLIRDKEFNDQTLIKATTPVFNGKDAYSKGYYEHINQGIMTRTQLNLGLMMDINNTDLTINGDRMTYDYSKANDMVTVTVNGNKTEELQRDEEAASDISIKDDDFTRVYNQAVYKSDYNFRIEDYKDYEGKLDITKTENRELQVYVTYKIKVKNNLSKTAGVSELKLYYDNYAFNYFGKTYDDKNDKISDLKSGMYKDSWYKTGETEGTVTWEHVDGTYADYSLMKASTINENGKLGDLLLEPNESLYVYVRFQLQKHDEEDLKRKIVAGERYIVTEISGYTSPEGLIDINSAPNNIDMTNPWASYKTSTEDDTDRAPGINVVSDEKRIREMTGFVFEDVANDTIGDGVKTGNGKFDADEGDTKRNLVVVQLIEIVNIEGDPTPHEYIWQEAITGSGKVQFMDKNGKLSEQSKDVGTMDIGHFKFTDYIPGNFIVRFRYGQLDDNGIVVLSGQDYKDTKFVGFGDNTSSAKDNKVRRQEVMNYSNGVNNEISYNIAMILKNEGANPKELIKNTWMNADTDTMVIRIVDNDPGHKVDFGVVERPKSKLTINKEIIGVKVTNKGIPIIDTENGKGKQIVDPKNVLQELDEELMNGAILEVKYRITVSNEGELDTLYNYFGDDVANAHKHITTSATLVYDYPEKLGFDGASNPTWLVNDTNLDILSPAARKDIQNQIAKGTGLAIRSEGQALNKELIPADSKQEGDKTATSEIILRRVLAKGTDDDFEYDNAVEIVKVKNAVGRRDMASIYGNFAPYSDDGSNEEPDKSMTTVTITPPAGLTNNPHYEIWIVSAAILVVGIILIKVFVLRKKD